MVVEEVTVAFTTLGPDPGVASLVLSVTVKLGSEVPKKGHIRLLKYTFLNFLGLLICEDVNFDFMKYI
jgi:hypothetical protein